MKSELFNFKLNRVFPRHAVVFAKNYFKGKEVCCAEVGVYSGIHARNIFDNLNVKKILLIDPYEDYDPDDSSSYNLLAAKVEAHNRFHLIDDSFVEFMEMKSITASTKIGSETLDFVYIDANHNYKEVVSDINFFWHKIKKGGILAGHDFNVFDVAKAVVHFSDAHNLKVQTGTEDWWIIKE